MSDEVFHAATFSDDTRNLHAEIAQRLFGYTWIPQTEVWMGKPCPAYTTDPAATAQVWQWLERKVHALQSTGLTISLVATAQGGWTYLCFLPGVEAQGATWPEALCRAALALAEALEKERSDE